MAARLVEAVESARSFLVLLGAAFAAAGVYLAWAFERILGLATLIVGAFLMVLPFALGHPDE